MTALTTTHAGSLATTQPQQLGGAAFFTEAQEQMLLKTFLGGATKDEAMVLLETVRRRRLDPFSRQVYFVKRFDSAKREEVWAIQTSIDGLRSIAERTGKYDGQDEPTYGKDEKGEFCKVKVYRKDWSAGRYAMGIAYLAEFIQKKKDGTVTAFWARMPQLMLAKCAEALAIRKAFPEDTGGLYIAEEMGQPPPVETNVTPHVEAPMAPSLPPPVEAQQLPRALASGGAIALWSRLVRECGEDKARARELLDAACAKHFGHVVPSREWTDHDLVELERLLFDIAY
jgi:phage recombination protein Bet